MIRFSRVLSMITPRIKTLWIEFKGRFLEASVAIIDSKDPTALLPALWIKLVEQRSRDPF